MSQKETGAVRSADSDQLDFTSLPIIGLFGVARTAKEGATKYARLNYMKGFPVHDILNHALIHIYMYLAGDRSEPNLEHAAWGLLAAVQQQTLSPELSEPHLLGPGASLTEANLNYLSEQEAVLGPKRATGEFAGVGDWKLEEVPQIAKLLRQRKKPWTYSVKFNGDVMLNDKFVPSGPVNNQGTFSFEAGKALDGNFEVSFGKAYPDESSEPRHTCCTCIKEGGCTMSECHAQACLAKSGTCGNVFGCRYFMVVPPSYSVNPSVPTPNRELDELSDKIDEVLGPDDRYTSLPYMDGIVTQDRARTPKYETPYQDLNGTLHFPKPIPYREHHGQETKSRPIRPHGPGCKCDECSAFDMNVRP